MCVSSFSSWSLNHLYVSQKNTHNLLTLGNLPQIFGGENDEASKAQPRQRQYNYGYGVRFVDCVPTQKIQSLLWRSIEQANCDAQKNAAIHG